LVAGEAMSDVGFGKKRKKGFRPKKTKGQRGEKACFLLLSLRSFISFVCEKRKKGFRPKKTKMKGQRVEKGCFLLVCLRSFISFVCEKKEERFSREEDEGTKGGEGMLPVGVPSILYFLCV
jgi:hypothetical protein